MLSTTRTMITTQSSSITIINNGWVIKNNASDQPCPKGWDSLYQTWDNLSEIWNHPAMLMQWPIPPKLTSESLQKLESHPRGLQKNTLTHCALQIKFQKVCKRNCGVYLIVHQKIILESCLSALECLS